MKTILITVAALVSAASAATIYNTSGASGNATSGGTNTVLAAQTFTTPASFANAEDRLGVISIVSASSFANVAGTNAPAAAGSAIMLKFFDVANGTTAPTPSSTVLGTAMGVATYTAGTFMTFDFAGSVILQANKAYAFSIYSADGTTPLSMRALFATSNSIADGQIFGSNAPNAAWDVAGTITTVVPEPTVALLGGVGALALLRRRRA